MADTEFRAPQGREPTFVKPLDTASRRRSRASHDSAAASTRSWVLMTQQNPPPPVEPIPLPEPVPGLSPSIRPLPEPPRRLSVVNSAEPGAEHMEVDAEAGLGYQWTTGRGAKAREAHGKGFVGGFVSGLRRLPRAFVRTRRPRRGTGVTEATEGTGTEGTGMSGNTLPRYVSNPPTPVVSAARVEFVRTGREAFAAGVDQNQSAEEEGRRRRHPSFRVVPPEEDVQQGIPTPIVYNQEDGHGEGEGEAIPGAFDLPQAPLENPYDRDTTSNHAAAASPPAASPHLSRADDRLAAPAADGDEPVSVPTHPVPTGDYRRMSAQHARPGSGTTINSGSFSTDTPSFSAELNGVHRFFHALRVLPWVATDRVTADYSPRPRSRALVSWYHPPAEPDSALEHPAPASPSDTPRNPPRHRTHRRATVSADASPTPPAGYGYPVAYYSTFTPPSTPPMPSRRHPPARRANRHHRRSATYHGHVHGPVPWAPPMLPAPPTPVYVVQASPPPPGASPGDETGSKHGGSAAGAQMLAPVYMQMQFMPNASGERVAFVPGQGSPGFAYAYSSPITTPAPAQTV